jgi:hypothetical protein
MPINWPELSDEELRIQARSGQETYQAAAIEAIWRLRKSIDALRQSTDKYSWLLVWLTGVLAVLTAVLVVLTAVLVFLAIEKTAIHRPLGSFDSFRGVPCH